MSFLPSFPTPANRNLGAQLQTPIAPPARPPHQAVYRSSRRRRLLSAVNAQFSHLLVNLQDPVLADKRVRQAISYAFDRDTLNSTLYNGQAEPLTGGPAPSWSDWHHATLDVYTHNQAQSLDLLASAGYGDTLNSPIPLNLVIRDGDHHADSMAQIIDLHLADVGIDATILKQTPANYDASVRSGAFDLALDWWEGDQGDIDWATTLYHSASLANYSGYNSAEYDQLIDLAAAETDPLEKKALYDQAQELLADDLPSVYVLSDLPNDGMTVFQQFSTMYAHEGIVASERREDIGGVPVLPDSIAGDPDYLVRVDLLGFQDGQHLLTVTDNHALTVWSDTDRTTAITGYAAGHNQAAITLDDQTPTTVWVEYRYATLADRAALVLTLDSNAGHFLAAERKVPTGYGPKNDLTDFVKVGRLAVGFSGHGQAAVQPGDSGSWKVKNLTGIVDIYLKLFNDSKTGVVLFPENPMTDDLDLKDFLHCGTGVHNEDHGAYRFVRKAFVEHQAQKLGAFGYSHGGGSVWLLTAMIDTMEGHGGPGNKVVPDSTRGSRPEITVAADAAFATAWKEDSLEWTAYIDAVGVNGPIPEYRVPYMTKNHFNRYQDTVYKPDLPLHGAATTKTSDGSANWTPPAGFILDQNNTDKPDNPQDPQGDSNPANTAVYNNKWVNPWKADALSHGTIQRDPHVISHLVEHFLKAVWA